MNHNYMDIGTAKDYADIVIETLHSWRIISEQAYGKITAEQREELASKIVARSEE